LYSYSLTQNSASGAHAGANSAFALPFANPRRTPNGDAYNYNNGYVLTDISGNAGNQTWYWGYDNSSQVNFANNTIAFDRTVMANVIRKKADTTTVVVSAQDNLFLTDGHTIPGGSITFTKRFGPRQR